MNENASERAPSPVGPRIEQGWLIIPGNEGLFGTTIRVTSIEAVEEYDENEEEDPVTTLLVLAREKRLVVGPRELFAVITELLLVYERACNSNLY